MLNTTQVLGESLGFEPSEITPERNEELYEEWRKCKVEDYMCYSEREQSIGSDEGFSNCSCAGCSAHGDRPQEIPV